jgi:heavy metal translocating P-type ATPase
MNVENLFQPPKSEYALIVAVVGALALDFLFPALWPALFLVALAGSFPTVAGAWRSVLSARVNIDTFNVFALIISFATGELRSAAFIVLMLTFARLLDWHTESRAHHAVEELLKLKPEKALRERRSEIKEIPASEIRKGDIIVAEDGSRIAVDGTVVFGEAYVNEAPVSGESVPQRKIPGDAVLGGTLVESGAVKFKAERVGKDSTIERMAELVRQAGMHKSHSEKLADRFAAILLPVVAVAGALVYFFTRNVLMVASLFLVACADDMALAIPLAIRASLGRAARRGVIIKGGGWLESLSKVKTVIVDKTGTLTYGTLMVCDVHIESGIGEEKFWCLVGAAEKFSEHPVGKAVFSAAKEKIGKLDDPDAFEVEKGSGVVAGVGKDKVIIGNEEVLKAAGVKLKRSLMEKFFAERGRHVATALLVVFNGKFAGTICVEDVPRSEAKDSLLALGSAGVGKIVMFTGDNPETAARISRALGVREFRAGMKPEDKLREIEKLLKGGTLAMVGDGVNDAPALARADVGIAMGGGGTAIAVEAADVVVLTDNLSRLPEMMELGKKTMSVIRGDMWLWLFSNVVGFALVLTGIAGPAFAAFYNFATDFLPLMNSARLFGGKY